MVKLVCQWYKKTVTEFFGKEPRKDVNPDEAVALGAAIQGGVLSGDVTDVLLLDVTPLSLGLETMGGVMVKIIEKNTTIPCSRTQTFSTAEDNQTAVTIHVLQGEREQAKYNKSLGQFNLEGIPSARRGEPQIEVKFDLDADGILHVSALEKVSGKQQKITIKSSGGLSEEEINRLIKDAEENAEKDKMFKEVVELRNQADSMVHKLTTEKSNYKSQEFDKVMSEVEPLLKSENVNDLKSAIAKLEDLAMNGRLDQESTQQSQDSKDEVVDGEFEEVK